MTKRKKKEIPPAEKRDLIDICKEAAAFPQKLLDEIDEEIDHAMGKVQKGSQEELDVFFRSKLFCIFRQFHDDLLGAIINRPMAVFKEKES